MTTEWLHIETMVGDPWILRIWTAVNDAENSGRVPPISREVKSRLGLSISTRLDMLPRVVYRINDEADKIYKATKAHKEEHVFSKQKSGCVFKLDEDLKYNLLIDIDSLFFELYSVCELMTDLFCVLYANIGKPIPKKKVGSTIKKIIEDAGKPSDWFQKLVRHRNFFIHESAPYLAVDISRGPGKYDLLIMRENLYSFEDQSQFIRLSEINSIVQGFAAATPIFQKHLIELYQEIP